MPTAVRVAGGVVAVVLAVVGAPTAVMTVTDLWTDPFPGYSDGGFSLSAALQQAPVLGPLVFTTLVGVALAGLTAWAWYAPPPAFQRAESAQPTEGAVVVVSFLRGGPWPDVAAVMVLAALAATVLLRRVPQQDRAFT